MQYAGKRNVDSSKQMALPQIFFILNFHYSHCSQEKAGGMPRIGKLLPMHIFVQRRKKKIIISFLSDLKNTINSSSVGYLKKVETVLFLQCIRNP